jgi:hypothetical protein
VGCGVRSDRGFVEIGQLPVEFPQNPVEPLFQLSSEVIRKFASQKSAEEKEGTKERSKGVPENLCRHKVSHNRGDCQGRARADHHYAPGDHSPLEAGYIFANCFSSNPILLAFRRRTVHVTS